MRFEIRPWIGALPFEFGRSVQEVRALAGEPPRPFRKSPDSAHFTDAFPRLGLHVDYTRRGTCCALELATPAIVAWDGLSMLDCTFTALFGRLHLKDKSVDVNASGATAKGIGIAVYAPFHDEDPELPCESIFVFDETYYSDADAG